MIHFSLVTDGTYQKKVWLPMVLQDAKFFLVNIEMVLVLSSHGCQVDADG
jgi:hypothetical protein